MKQMDWLRNGLAVVGVLMLGYWLGSARGVKAAPDDLAFQLTDVGERSALLVYQPSTRTIFVYQGATTGNSHLQCSYKYSVGGPGAGIERQQCGVGSLR